MVGGGGGRHGGDCLTVCVCVEIVWLGEYRVNVCGLRVVLKYWRHGRREGSSSEHGNKRDVPELWCVSVLWERHKCVCGGGTSVEERRINVHEAYTQT